MQLDNSKLQNNKQKVIKALGIVIKKYRQKNGLSLNLLANQLQTSKTVISLIEQGMKDPQFTTLWRICEGLNISFTDLIREVENELPEGFNLSDLE